MAKNGDVSPRVTVWQIRDSHPFLDTLPLEGGIRIPFSGLWEAPRLPQASKQGGKVMMPISSPRLLLPVLKPFLGVLSHYGRSRVTRGRHAVEVTGRHIIQPSRLSPALQPPPSKHETPKTVSKAILDRPSQAAQQLAPLSDLSEFCVKQKNHPAEPCWNACPPN